MQIVSKRLVLIYKMGGLVYELSALANDCDFLCIMHYYFCIIVTMIAKSVILASVQRNGVFIISCFFSVFEDF